jgi:hypothetical protein
MQFVMLRSTWKRAVLVAAILAALGSCSSTPVLLNASEEGVVVRYNPDSVTSADAVAAAQASCQRYGRNAVAQETQRTGEVFTTFACVRPPASATPTH